VAELKGGFLSSFGQGFKEDFAREDVRGHFDLGSPPNTRRYYCMYDPKKRKNQPNGISGEPVPRRDGTTGIKGAAVTPLSCADAEQKGLLVTEGYTLSGAGPAAPAATPAAKTTAPAAGTAAAATAGAAAATTAAAAPAPTAAPAPAPAVAAPTPAPAVAAAAPLAAAPATPAAASSEKEVLAIYERFIAGENAHDRAAVAAVLLDSKDFVWARYGGDSIFGYTQALDAFQSEWKGIWRVDPQLTEARVTSPAPGVAVLVTPLLFTAAAPGASPTMVPIRWAGVFVNTKSGWRIASIFITPFRDWRAPAG
jgi:hypothetical protein